MEDFEALMEEGLPLGVSVESCCCCCCECLHLHLHDHYYGVGMRGRKCSSSWFGPRMWAGSRRGRSLPCGRGLALPEGLLPPGRALASPRLGSGPSMSGQARRGWSRPCFCMTPPAASRCSLRAHNGRLLCLLLSSAMAGCDVFLRKGGCPGQEGRLCIAERSRGLGAASQGTWSLWRWRDGSPFGVCSMCIQCLKQKETGDPV
nr:PREDICTED: uncharacterized protein LOC103281196 [Anolis carolinensis]|eukprot:XP_016853553.1 PREDICTED: uncharacterized protein LOC103281196 [Anolis carolinensis]